MPSACQLIAGIKDPWVNDIDALVLDTSLEISNLTIIMVIGHSKAQRFWNIQPRLVSQLTIKFNQCANSRRDS